MGAQYHNGHWYGGGQDIDIQSDPTATSLDANSVPTGATLNNVLTWKNLLASGNNFIPTAAESTINLSKSLEDIHEMMVVLRSYGSGYQAIRQSIIIPNPNAELSALVFPDFMFAGTRMYFGMVKATNTSIKISNASPTSGSVYWGGQVASLFYR